MLLRVHYQKNWNLVLRVVLAFFRFSSKLSLALGAKWIHAIKNAVFCFFILHFEFSFYLVLSIVLRWILNLVMKKGRYTLKWIRMHLPEAQLWILDLTFLQGRIYFFRYVNVCVCECFCLNPYPTLTFLLFVWLSVSSSERVLS